MRSPDLQAPTGLLLGAQQPDEAMRALRQAVGLPAAEDRVNVAESLLGQSPDAKSSNPTRQLKRAYAAMLQAVKENHLAEKENLIRVSTCRTFLGGPIHQLPCTRSAWRCCQAYMLTLQGMRMHVSCR